MSNARPTHLLDPGMCLTLRPMTYPAFYEMYRTAIKNTWSVEEVNFSTDITDLSSKMTEAECHLIRRLVAFFATGDSIVSNNLVLNLYKHINAPEARMYLSRQLYEEALHVQFYLTLLDTYVPEPDERALAFAAVDNIPSIRAKAEFCNKWIDSIQGIEHIETREQRKQFLLNLICFAACIEGLFFFAAFAYVYFLRSKGLLHGLSAGTSWVFRDESCVPIPYTDLLTERGFLPLDQVLREQNIRVAQYTEQGAIEFVLPRAYVRKPFSGKLIKVVTDKSMSLTTTPDHDNVTRSKTTRKLRKTVAPETSTSSSSELICAGFGTGSHIELTDIERFAIAYQADAAERIKGDGSRGGTVGVSFDLTKSRKRERLEALLTRLGWEYTTSDSDLRRSFYVKVSVEHLPLLVKDFSWVPLSEINGTWCHEFVDELQHWDGYVADDRTCIQFTNTNESAANIVQAIATMAGCTSSIYRRPDDRKETYRDVFNVFIKQRDAVDLHRAAKIEVPYEGEVGCVNVPSGMIIVRQEGKVAITGNCHMAFAFEVVDVVRREEPYLFDAKLEADVRTMIAEAIECETLFATDLLEKGIAGLSVVDVRQYLQYCADQRLVTLGFAKEYNAKNPFQFMDLQDVQEVTNFFERRVSAYQMGVEGEVSLDAAF